MSILDYVRFEWLLADPPLSTSTAWTDITATGLVRRIVVDERRVGGYLGDAIRTTVEVELEDPDGRFSAPSGYAAAPYAGNVVPNKAVRVSISTNAFATSRVLAFCFVDNVRPTSTPFETSVTVTASDTFRLLEREVVDWVRPAELTGTRLSALLAQVGIPNGGASRDLIGTIDAGTVWLAPGTYSGQALAIAQDIVRAEMGQLRTDGNGAIQFRDRYEYLGNPSQSTSQATFGGEEIDNGAIEHGLSAFTTPDEVSASGASGKRFTFTSANMPSGFPPVGASRAGTPILFDGDVEMIAEGLQKQLEPADRDEPAPVGPLRVWVATVNSTGNVGGTSSVRTELGNAALSVMHYVSAVYRPGGWSSDFTFEGRVEGMRHVFENVDGGCNWYVDVTLGRSLNVWLAESANHYYQLGATLTSDRRGAL